MRTLEAAFVNATLVVTLSLLCATSGSNQLGLVAKNVE
jgi:hypothetical protein